MGRYLHLAHPYGHVHHLICVQRVLYQQHYATLTLMTLMILVSLSKQVLGPVSAALCLLCLLGDQHDDEHNMAVAVGQRVCLMCLLFSSTTQIFGLIGA